MWNFLVSFKSPVVRRDKAKAALRTLEVSLLTMLDKNMELKHFLIFYLHSATAQLDLPKCWIHYGECLDDNQPPLNIKDIVKPLPNENVIRIEKGVQTIEDCKNKCEDVSTCTFYTLYKDDLNKNCQIVRSINFDQK